MLNRFRFLCYIALSLVGICGSSLVAADDLTQWQPLPATWKPIAVAPGQATLHNSGWDRRPSRLPTATPTPPAHSQASFARSPTRSPAGWPSATNRRD